MRDKEAYDEVRLEGSDLIDDQETFDGYWEDLFKFIKGSKKLRSVDRSKLDRLAFNLISVAICKGFELKWPEK